MYLFCQFANLLGILSEHKTWVRNPVSFGSWSWQTGLCWSPLLLCCIMPSSTYTCGLDHILHWTTSESHIFPKRNCHEFNSALERPGWGLCLQIAVPSECSCWNHSTYANHSGAYFSVWILSRTISWPSAQYFLHCPQWQGNALHCTVQVENNSTIRIEASVWMSKGPVSTEKLFRDFWRWASPGPPDLHEGGEQNAREVEWLLESPETLWIPHADEVNVAGEDGVLCHWPHLLCWFPVFGHWSFHAVRMSRWDCLSIV